MIRINSVLMLGLILTAVATAAEPVKLPPGVTLEENPKDAKTKIVLIAGSNYFKPGEHEYLAGCAVLAKLLAENPGVAPVFAVDWPTKPETFANAKAVVFLFDGGDKHAILKENRVEQIQKLVDSGVGLVQFHQAVDYPKDLGEKVRSWTGGCWEKGMGARAHWISEFKDFPTHPITRGVEPFKINDGYITKIHFVDGMKGVTPLLHTEDPKAKTKLKPEETMIAWAFERPGGGRSFTFTGAHLHASFNEPGYRKFLVNGILWSAGVEIPKDGAKSDIDAKDIAAVLAPPPPPAKK